jgi:hypothetical protein
MSLADAVRLSRMVRCCCRLLIVILFNAVDNDLVEMCSGGD